MSDAYRPRKDQPVRAIQYRSEGVFLLEKMRVMTWLIEQGLRIDVVTSGFQSDLIKFKTHNPTSPWYTADQGQYIALDENGSVNVYDGDDFAQKFEPVEESVSEQSEETHISEADRNLLHTITGDINHWREQGVFYLEPNIPSDMRIVIDKLGKLAEKR